MRFWTLVYDGTNEHVPPPGMLFLTENSAKQAAAQHPVACHPEPLFWTLLHDDNNEPVVPIDECAAGMFFPTKDLAQQAAALHKRLYDVDCHPGPL